MSVRVLVFCFLVATVLGQPFFVPPNYLFFHYYPLTAPIDAGIETSGTLAKHITNEMFTTVATYNSNPYLLLYGGLTPGYSVNSVLGNTLLEGHSSLWGPGNLPIFVDTKLKVDSSGWAVEWQKFTNIGGSPVTLDIANGFNDQIFDPSGTAEDLLGTDLGHTIATDQNDHWAVLLANFYAGQQLYVGIANGDFAAYFDVEDGQSNIGWGINPVTVNPGEYFSILRAFAINDVLTGPAFTLRVDGVVASANNFYSYVSPNYGTRLLDFLSASELLSVVNWDFLGAGVGGDPHGIHFDTNPFELTDAGIYCLYHDHLVQVNIRVSELHNYVKEIVIFLRDSQRVIHARMDEDDLPEYSINNELIEMPSSSENGFLVAREGAFDFPGILGVLGRYHVNALVVGPYVTIVGGYRPVTGGFFNVVVNHRVVEFDFPSILQWHDHPALRGLGMEISSSVLSDIWISAPQ